MAIKHSVVWLSHERDKGDPENGEGNSLNFCPVQCGERGPVCPLAANPHPSPAQATTDLLPVSLLFWNFVEMEACSKQDFASGCVY